MSGIRVVCLSLLAASLMLSGWGCTKNKGAGKENGEDSVSESPANQAEKLQAAVQSLYDTLGQLPSGNDAQDQQNIGAGIGQMATALRLMADDVQGGAFQQQLESMDRSSDMLTHGTLDRDPEPIINSGLWASLNALQTLSRRFEDSQTLEQVAQLDSKVRATERVRGPLHRLAATDALRSAAVAVARMAQLSTDAMQREAARAAEATSAE